MRGSDGAEPVAPTGGRHFVRTGPSRRWLTTFGALLGVALVAGAALTYVGVQTLRDSRAGRSVSTVRDPSAPGFEALLEPTPTLAVVHRDGSSVRSMAVLALHSGDVGGSVLLVAPDLRISLQDSVPTFAALAAFGGGPETVLGPLQASLGFGITEVALVDDARLAELVAPVAPLSFDSPSAAGSFPAGPVTVPADQVGAFLAARSEGEAPPSAMLRQRALYQAWIDAVAASGDEGAVPGELDSGIGRFVRGLAAGPHRLEAVPIAERTVGDVVRLDIDAEVMAALVGELVPFPTAGGPGGRVRVRLLDGTGDARHVQTAAPLLVPADAQIVVVGNADAFDYAETEVRFHTPVVKAAARDILESLGAGRLVEDPRQTDAFDVTIVLGTDV